MKKPKLSVIILSWNTQKLLLACLKSVFASQKKASFALEVIVVDNASSDQSVSLVKKRFPRVKLVVNRQNLGFARGNNQGAQKATGEYLLFLNSDTLVLPGALAALLAPLLKNDFAAVSPQLFLPSGRPQIDYYLRFPNLWQLLFYHFPPFRPLVTKTFLRFLIANRVFLRPFPVDQLPGAALMVSRRVWFKVGGFDEAFTFFYEDVDWSWRAALLGFRRGVVPGAKIVHYGGASWQQKKTAGPLLFYRQFFGSLLLFVRKNYPPFAHFCFYWLIIFNFLITFKWPLAWQFLKKDFSLEKKWLSV